MTYNAEIWMESMTRTIKAYVEAALVAPLDSAYEVVMEWPGALLDNQKVPTDRAIIHFEIDEVTTRPVGFGDNLFADNYDATNQQVNPQEARVHMVNFDVGIWAFDANGGTTARMRAYQLLTNLFGGASGQTKMRDFSDGGDGQVEILQFTGGRFVSDRVNDVPVYRTVNGELRVRVYSRSPLTPDGVGPSIEQIDQDPNLTITT